MKIKGIVSVVEAVAGLVISVNSFPNSPDGIHAAKLHFMSCVTENCSGSTPSLDEIWTVGFAEEGDYTVCYHVHL